jgi:collagenase-like PrtC family protease
MKTLQLTLGPVLFYWSRDDILRFYSEAADWPLETIYLGEAVCSRRQQLRGQDWISLGRELAQSGRQVVLSSQALIESESDLRRLRKLVENGELQLEANDLGAARLAQQQGQPFVAGHHLNIYNADTLALMQSLGARRWIPPVEMDRDTLARYWDRPPSMVCRSKPSCLPGAGCHWPCLPAALPPATTICPRTTASSAAWNTRTGCA